MRLIKMLGLAAIAALAAMAFAGVGTASAQEHFEVLCKENPGEGLCKSGELYPSGTTILAELEPLGEEKHAVLLPEGGTQEELCAQSHVEGKITQASPAQGEITSLTFTECTPCKTVTVNNLPYSVEIKHDEVGEHLWLMRVTGEILVTFTCPFLIKCFYKASEIVLGMVNNEGLPLILTLENLLTAHNNSPGLCGVGGIWDANYRVSVPDPAWLALDETEA